MARHRCVGFPVCNGADCVRVSRHVRALVARRRLDGAGPYCDRRWYYADRRRHCASPRCRVHVVSDIRRGCAHVASNPTGHRDAGRCAWRRSRLRSDYLASDVACRNSAGDRPFPANWFSLVGPDFRAPTVRDDSTGFHDPTSTGRIRVSAHGHRLQRGEHRLVTSRCDSRGPRYILRLCGMSTICSLP